MTGQRSALVILLGPDEIEIERTNDLLDSVAVYEHANAANIDVIVVNDGNLNVGELHGHLTRFGRPIRVDNPLAGKRSDRFDRHTAGMLAALDEATKHGPYAFVLKLDTDALIVNTFSDALTDFFTAQPKVGAAGSFRMTPDGTARATNEYWVRRIRRATALPLRRPQSIRRTVRRRKIVADARHHGYADGDHVLGGSYAISGKVLDLWRSPGRLVSLFEGTELGEDAVVSLLIQAAGFELADLNRPGEVFGVWFRELGLPPETLVERFAVIHSLKSGDHQDEDTLRRIFRRYREDFRLAAGAGDKAQ